MKALLRFVVVIAFSFCLFAKAEEGNPIFKLVSILGELEDSTNSFAEIDEKLSQIKPVACDVDEISLTKSEVEFMINAFRLSFAVDLKKGELALAMAKNIESMYNSGQVDIKKLNSLLGSILQDENYDLETLMDIDVPQAYIITNNCEKVIDRCQKSLKKYKKGSIEYIHIRFSLGTAFLKMGQHKLAEKPLLEALEFFEKNKNQTQAGIAASNLSAVYGALNNKKKAKKYSEIAKKYANNTDSDVIRCEQALISLIKSLEIDKMNKKQMKTFEESREFILTKSTSDLQIWAVYVFSSIIKAQNEYRDEEILSEMEKAYMYRAIIWGDGEVGNVMKQIDVFLEELKKVLLEKLAEGKQVERLNYWNAQFEKSRQRHSSMLSVASSGDKEFLPIMDLVSRYENAKQILAIEGAKASGEQDKKLIAKATEIKRQLEQQFEEAKKQLSDKDKSKLNELLADNFVIHPDSLGQLSTVLPKDLACLQYLLVEDTLAVFIIVKDTPPFMTCFPLSKFNSSNKDFLKLLLKTRALLQTKSDNKILNEQLNKLYKILFSDIEEPLKKLGTKELIVNSSGILRYIPFAALYDGSQYFVEKYQITNITGLDLVRLSKMAPKRQFFDTNIAVFADPDGSLPAGRNEGKVISELFQNSQFIVGDKATLKEFEALLGDVNFIHLATHAVLDPNNPEQSYILFANGMKWHYADMMGFNVKNVDSIVLSACSTAVSEKSTGGEIEGMAYQLLRKSPSGSVLASLWPVDDEATAELMTTYYTHIVNSIKNYRTLDRGGALREAQLKLLANPKTASPYYWAAFTLFGDYR